MRIAIVHSFYSSKHPSGENEFVLALAEALSVAGHEVRLFAQRTDDLEKSKLYKIRSFMTVALGVGANPLSKLREFNPDVVHVHNLFPNWGTDWLKDSEFPIVATVHNFRPVCAAGTLFRNGQVCMDCVTKTPFESVWNRCYKDSIIATVPLAISQRGGLDKNSLLAKSAKVLLPSRQAADLYASFGLDATKCLFVPGTASQPTSTTPPSEGDSWVFIGRLSSEKGAINLMKNWPSKRNLKVYGSGPLMDEVQQLQTSNATYEGMLSKSAVTEVLASARGLVFTSECFEGGTPLIYIEALASGRPVIALKGNSVATDLSIQGAGVVFNEWAGLADALELAESNLNNYGRQAQLSFESTYSQESFVRNHIAAYESAILG